MQNDQQPPATRTLTRRSALKITTGAVATSVSMPALAQSQITLEFPTYQIDESFGTWWKALIEVTSRDVV